ncbi:MAG: hypothetical protein HYY01_08145 [Chloroflexi bacterium]|nr:hypothetical protein [Chloroflexota bacterium]
MVGQTAASGPVAIWLSGEELETLEQALSFLLMSSSREERVYGPIWGLLHKIQASRGISEETKLAA